MYRAVHSVPDHIDFANPSTSDFHYPTSEQSSTLVQPLMASKTHPKPGLHGKHSYPPTPGTLESGSASDTNAHGLNRTSNFLHEGFSYDPSNAKEGYLRMAKGDVPDNKVYQESRAGESNFSPKAPRPAFQIWTPHTCCRRGCCSTFGISGSCLGFVKPSLPLLWGIFSPSKAPPLRRRVLHRTPEQVENAHLDIL
jgi:hypothetical protein